MEKYYAGIGARKTPSDILEVFSYLGEELAKRGYILRSGRAEGADSAFERGCDKVSGRKEIFLPWKGFQGAIAGDSVFYQYDNVAEAIEIAKKFHPYWESLSNGGRALMTRNGFQVLGKDLVTPSDFIICWTEGGEGGGGTGQALRIAKEYGIKICDFGRFPKEQAWKVADKLLNSLTPEYLSELESSIHFPEEEKEQAER